MQEPNLTVIPDCATDEHSESRALLCARATSHRSAYATADHAKRQGQGRMDQTQKGRLRRRRRRYIARVRRPQLPLVTQSIRLFPSQ